MKYGVFIQTMFEFVIIAFVLFMVIKGINRLKRQPPAAPPAAPPPPPREEVLLEEIRDLLASRKPDPTQRGYDGAQLAHPGRLQP